MDETIRFWRDMLGMRLIGGLGKPSYRKYLFQVSNTDMIAFFQWRGAEPIEEKDAGRTQKGPIAFDHICVEVENKEDLWNLKEKLENADLWVSETIDNGIMHSIFTFDPNGISLEICCTAGELNLINTPTMVDETPTSEALKGSEPIPNEPPATYPNEPTKIDQNNRERKLYRGFLKDLIEKKNKW
ncbi:glyoxalase/bleomycin resistance protein/dioxygenase [Candidatus Magnetoovum chiemensis]|nr:glyoxalase/bleomycin resistance protein/dioxygenase [Candidatus Magnetoovum chiemensis]